MGKHEIIWLTECDSLGKPHTVLDQAGSSGEEGKDLAFDSGLSPAARPQQAQYPYSCLARIIRETSDKTAATPLPPQCHVGLRGEAILTLRVGISPSRRALVRQGGEGLAAQSCAKA